MGGYGFGFGTWRRRGGASVPADAWPEGLPSNYFRLSSLEGLTVNGSNQITAVQTTGDLTPGLVVRGTGITYDAAKKEVVFPGAAGNLLYEGTPVAHTNDFTLFCCIRVDTTFASSAALMSKYIPTGNRRSWILTRNGGDGLSCVVSVNGLSGAGNATTAAIAPSKNPTEWTTCVIRKSGATLSRWIDGQRLTDVTVGSVLYDPTAPICIGASESVGGSAGANHVLGRGREFGWYNSAISDPQCEALSAFLEARLPVTPLTLNWGGNPLTLDDIDDADGVVRSLVATPNGDSPTEGALESHRFHHHTRVVKHNGRVWVAYSSSGTNEDAGGQMSLVKSSADDGATWSAAQIICPPQSAFSGTGAGLVSGTRISYPRAFVVHDGKLYAVSSFETVTGGNNMTGIAMVACECLDDGTLGPLFRITSASYTPASGITAIAYDATLGPALFPAANIYGTWGGSTPNNAASQYLGWWGAFGSMLCEPATCRLTDGRLFRIWRRIGPAVDERLQCHVSGDDGATWSGIKTTGVPDNPSASAVAFLSTGKIAVVGSPVTGVAKRRPLYLAIFGLGGELEYLRAIENTLSASPTYSGLYKDGAAAYPCIFEAAGYLYVSFSGRGKEDIYMARLPLPVAPY